MGPVLQWHIVADGKDRLGAPSNLRERHLLEPFASHCPGSIGRRGRGKGHQRLTAGGICDLPDQPARFQRPQERNCPMASG
eukprot:937366-Alexandrium_andersonii.AAC.1